MRFTEQQLTAIERRDSSILVSAGAGTGKTSVLVERFVRAVRDDGVDVASILAITFTEKAAAQLKQRVRARFVEFNDVGNARESEAAWISTIHGFCARVLRTHALAAGIDPEFRVLDAVEAERLALDAFDGALAEFLERGESAERLRMIAAYNPSKLADMVRTAYDHLRSQGKEPTLPVIDPPAPAGEREALAAAAARAAAELGAPEQKTVVAALDKVERCSALLDRLAPDALAPHGDVKGLGAKGTAKALQGPAYAEYLEAHAAYAALCLRHAEYLDHVLLRELIDLHGSRYARLKRDRSGLDFDDLELRTRDLLRDDDGLRAHYAERFTHVLVDEFQDTNPLQNEILELLERGNLFRVGDERQSIYRFRHADVKVFREHHERAAAEGTAEAIGVNFRSRGEVLDAIDLTFSELWGEEFDPLTEAPGTRDEPPRVDPCVEVLVTDKDKKRWDESFDPEDDDPFGSGMGGVTPWRAAEARLLAKRVEELTGNGPYELSDVVLLLRATTHMHIYERALEERGIPTYVLGGRGYWSQQQVGDLRHYLAALANPLDGLALYSVLASPLGGLSLDSLVLIAAEARRRHWDPWRTLTDPEAELGLEPDQAKRAQAFATRFAAERALAPRISLETLIDRAVTTSGYDREVLAMPAGDRRMANVRKLMRMAREYEAEEGRDLRGFIDFVAERDLVSEREGQAPLEAEDLDAVRLMTIHRAKGLEFPVVCVADLGKDGREDYRALRITDDGRVGIRLASLGGGSMDGAQLEAIRQEQKIEDEEEERRIFYVAATRAQEHLILSGATDLEKRDPPAPLQEPMRWIWPVLAPGLETGESEVDYRGRAVRVRCQVLRPGDAELLPAADRDPARPEPEPPGLGALAAPALAAVPIPAALPVSRLSYSGLEAYDRCGYRFYLDKALKLPRPGDAPAPAEQRDALPATLRGSIVHLLLERLDFAAPEAPAREAVAELIESFGEPVREHEVDDLCDMVERFVASDLRERIAAAATVRTELPFVFTLETEGRSLLVNGVVDVHAVEAGGGLLVVDYKSNHLEGRTPAAITESGYSTQRLVYALAALRSGAEAVDVVYVFLEQPDAPVSASFTQADAPGLERELLELAAGVTGGRFEPADDPHRELCADCPGREALCSWEPDRTLAPAEPA